VKNSTKRLPALERRKMIVDTSAKLFAKRGLHGVTTKEIAAACGISEPVLYQHFAGKEQIYQELQILCQGQTTYFKHVLKSLPLGSEWIVVTIYLLSYTVSQMKEPSLNNHKSEISEILTRLMGFSFLEDGRFAKTLIRDCIGALMPMLMESYDIAAKKGEIAGDVSRDEDLWLSYELIIGAAMFNMSKPALIPSLGDGDVFLERSVAYILRGIGLKESVIKKHHRPKDLRKWIGRET
jgi:AcrR family transcriptional regulator